MTVVSNLISERLSFSATDWRISGADQAAVVAALDGEIALDATLRDLGPQGLAMIFQRMGQTERLREAVQIIAGRSLSQRHAARAALVRAMRQSVGGPGVAVPSTVQRSETWYGGPATDFFDIAVDLAESGHRLGFAGGGGCAMPSRSMTGSGPGSPFSGVGATGVNPTKRTVPLGDQFWLLVGNGETTRLYKNPLNTNPGGYFRSLSPADIRAQVRQLVCQPVSTLFGRVFRGGPPLRSQVLSAAGRAHALEPELIAAIILAEQRDQSANEDAADYTSAASVVRHNASVGLGQVQISTVRNHDIFSDLLSPAVRRRLSHNQIAALLASGEFNIFATAAYARHVANLATTVPASRLGNTIAIFAGINLPAYRNHSRTWPEDNVAALGSEYTSEPWDDTIYNWHHQVRHAFRSVRAAGVVFP